MRVPAWRLPRRACPGEPAPAAPCRAVRSTQIRAPEPSGKRSKIRPAAQRRNRARPGRRRSQGTAHARSRRLRISRLNACWIFTRCAPRGRKGIRATNSPAADSHASRSPASAHSGRFLTYVGGQPGAAVSGPRMRLALSRQRLAIGSRARTRAKTGFVGGAECMPARPCVVRK